MTRHEKISSKYGVTRKIVFYRILASKWSTFKKMYTINGEISESDTSWKPFDL